MYFWVEDKITFKNLSMDILSAFYITNNARINFCPHFMQTCRIKTYMFRIFVRMHGMWNPKRTGEVLFCRLLAIVFKSTPSSETFTQLFHTGEHLVITMHIYN